MSASSGALARKAAGDPQGRRQRAERPAESGEDARTGRAAPDPAGVQQDGGASAMSGSAATSSASGVAHLLAAPAGSSGEPRSELAEAADTAAAEVLQRLQEAQDAKRVAHKEVSARAFIAPTQEQAVSPLDKPACMCLLSACCACIPGASSCGAWAWQLARPISRCSGRGGHQAQAQARGRAALRAGRGARGWHGA